MDFFSCISSYCWNCCWCIQSDLCLLWCTCSLLTTRSNLSPGATINFTSFDPQKSCPILEICSSSPTPGLSVIPQPPASQACNVGEGGDKVKYHSLPLCFPVWVTISLGFPWFSSIGMFEGREELSQVHRTEGRDGIPPEPQWAAWDFFLLLSCFPFPSELSALRAVRTCPAWRKVATRLSTFP